MRLREILTELNTRSKKISPNIFNEPIECGFEAEIVFTNLPDSDSYGSWEQARAKLKNQGAEDILNAIDGFALERVNAEMDAQDHLAADAAYDEYMSEKRAEHEENEEEFDEDYYMDLFYQEYEKQKSEYEIEYDENPRAVLDEEIENAIFNEYDNSVLEFISHFTRDSAKHSTSINNLPEYIINRWVKIESIIKTTKADDDAYEYDDRQLWNFVSDRSIYGYGKGYGIEMISPVYPTLDHMFRDMRSLFAWFVKEEVVVNDTTGLHVTLNLTEPQKNRLNELKLHVLALDDNILKDFKREKNRFARGASNKIEQAIIRSGVSLNDIKDFKNIEQEITKDLLANKYSSINVKNGDNFKSREGNDLVEFRSIGGKDYIKEENFYKIENAVKHYAICLKAAYSDVDYQSDYERLLYRLVHRAIYGNNEKITPDEDNYKINNKAHPFLYLMKSLMYPRSYSYFISDARKMFSEPDQFKQKDMFRSILGQLFTDIVAQNTKTNKTHYKIIKNIMKEMRVDKSDYISKGIFQYNLPMSAFEIEEKALKEIFKYEEEPTEENNNSIREHLLVIEKERLCD